MRRERNQRTVGKPCVSCPGINAITGASRCHASDRVERSCPDLNRHARFSWDKGVSLVSRTCIILRAPCLLDLSEKLINARVFLERRRCSIANCERNETRFVRRRDVDRCRRNKIAESPTLNCPVVLKFRSRKKFQVIGYQHRRIRVYQFGNFRVKIGRRASADGRQDEQMRTIGNRTSGSVQ